MLDPNMVTTIDNPYSPFTQWEDWYAYDTQYNHNTCSLLAMFTFAAEEIDVMADWFGMTELVRESPLGLHIMVTESQFDALKKEGLIGVVPEQPY